MSTTWDLKKHPVGVEHALAAMQIMSCYLGLIHGF